MGRNRRGVITVCDPPDVPPQAAPADSSSVLVYLTDDPGGGLRITGVSLPPPLPEKDKRKNQTDSCPVRISYMRFLVLMRAEGRLGVL